MKTTLTKYQIAGELMADEYAHWSRPAAYALAEHLEQWEEETGEEIEFDRVAIRCEFSEHASLQDWASDYFSGDWKADLGIDTLADDEEIDDGIRDYIRDHGQLIEFAGGVIVSSF